MKIKRGSSEHLSQSPKVISEAKHISSSTMLYCTPLEALHLERHPESEVPGTGAEEQTQAHGHPAEYEVHSYDLPICVGQTVLSLSLFCRPWCQRELCLCPLPFPQVPFPGATPAERALEGTWYIS